jgi:azurin
MHLRNLMAMGCVQGATLIAMACASLAAEPAPGRAGQTGQATLDAICGAAAASAPTTLPLKLERGARVVLIGNTLFDRMQEHGYFEAMLFQKFPREQLVLRTLAWPGDEVAVQSRPDEFGDLHAHIAFEKADVIIAAYGFNESFRGVQAVADFERELATLVASFKAHKYNGKSAPQIVLVSPIAHETLGAPLPDGRESNVRLRIYSDAIARVARACRVGFVDTFTPTLAAMEARNKRESLTFNGIHLTDGGYQQFAEVLYRGLIGESAGAFPDALKQAVEDRNRQFVRRYRALNAFYIYGGRAKPYGVVNFPGELAKLDQMVANRDHRIWDLAQGNAVPPKVDDSNTDPLPAITGDRPINEWMSPENELKAFRVDPRFEVSCFASEADFPEFAKPIQMRWDARGRLWVSCSQTYPQVTPGEEPNDRILILEDVNGDGKADKCTVFAEGLHIPLSFEFGDGGVYVSEQPHLTFLKDTDGDGRADVHKIVLTGFGTEDSHHALHDFTWSPDGDLVFRESIFLHSSVETPHGPVRARESSFFRFRPATWQMQAFGSYRSTNPWGLTFDEWGQHLGSHPVFASAVHALNARYPDIHIPAGDYFPAYSGTCGQEFIYSPHFPSELQGGFVRVRYKPVNTIEIHKWIEKDTHYEEELQGLLLQSSNLSFIPVDVRFGPRGDLYICDWYNPVKGHMQYSLRDTRRDKTSGRIWRVTARGRALLDPPRIAGQSVSALLDMLKRYEYRYRYWARRELREHSPSEVRPLLDQWVARLDPKDPRFLHHQMEAVWMYRGIREVNAPLLVSLLRAPDHHVRAAATQQLRYWHSNLPNSLDLLRERANDTNGLVRLEAAIAASYFLSSDAAAVALDLLKHPMDNYLTYALRTSLDSLKPAWEKNNGFIVAHPELPKFIAAASPAAKTPPRKAAQDPFDRLNPTLVKISTIAERMLFTVTEFKVKPNAPVKLILENPDVTPHNLLICQPGSEDEIGLAANEMAKLPDAFVKNDFVPKSDKILHATKMLNQHQTDTLRFRAPKTSGRYPYICSFPGHYLVMRGTMIVE